MGARRKASRDVKASMAGRAAGQSVWLASGKVSRRDGHHQRAPSPATPHSLSTRSCAQLLTWPCVVSVFPPRHAPALVSSPDSRPPPKRTCASLLPSKKKLWPTTRPRVPLLLRIWQVHRHSRTSRKTKVSRINVTPRFAHAQLSSRPVRPEHHGSRRLGDTLCLHGIHLGQASFDIKRDTRSFG